MMNRSTLLILIALLTLVAACKPSREKRAAQIQGLEKRLFSPQAMSFDKARADSLMALYDAFIKDHPKDTLSPAYLFKAANIAMNNGDGNKALALFDQYIRDYPDKPKAALCLFFKGFVYENSLHDFDKARETYLQFIEKYPTNEFVKDARMAIKNLGKTPEMIIREFEEQKKADSLRKADSLASASKAKKHK
jgi:outer membrane protein assembly factor BamD (BamD/ComL family)